MPTTQNVILLSPSEYIRAEEEGHIRHEYVDGYIHAKVNSNRRHNLIAMTLARLLGNHLQGGENRVLNTYKSGEVAVLESVKLSLPIDQIYTDVMGRV